MEKELSGLFKTCDCCGREFPNDTFFYRHREDNLPEENGLCYDCFWDEENGLCFDRDFGDS